MADLAFLVTAHANAPQLRLTLDSLWHRDCRYLVHVDHRGQPGCMDAAMDWANGRRRAELLHAREVVPCSWSIVSLVLAAIRQLLASSDWQTMVWCSGQCLPLRPIERIAAELRAGYSYVGWCDARAAWWPTVGPRVETVWSMDEVSRTMANSGIPCDVDAALGVPIYAGQSWCALSRDACEYLLGPGATRLRRFFCHTWGPDEMFIATALLNSPLADRVVNRPLWYARFANGATHPAVLSADDMPAISEASDNGALFARKFDVTSEPEATRLVGALATESAR